MNDLPLADLDAFTAVAAARSFRAAAKKRGVSASALSDSSKVRITPRPSMAAPS